MFEKMDMALLCARAKWNGFVNRLLHEEKGASDIVAIMLIIVIVLAVAVIFRDQLQSLVKDIFDRADNFIKETK